MRNINTINHYEPLEVLNHVYINNNSLVREVRQTIYEKLISAGKIPSTISVNQIRIRDKLGNNPGKILDISKSIAQNSVYLYDSKPIVIELCEKEEFLESDDGGNTLLLVQRWIRSTWSLGTRFEVYLNGSMSVSDICLGLCELTGIN